MNWIGRLGTTPGSWNRPLPGTSPTRPAAVGFAEALKTADLVITGEGCSDAQTAHGKAPLGVARLARKGGVPVICLSGGLGAVSFDGKLDQGALATARRNLGDKGVVLKGTLKVGNRTFNNVSMRWWAGD